MSEIFVVMHDDAVTLALLAWLSRIQSIWDAANAGPMCSHVGCISDQRWHGVCCCLNWFVGKNTDQYPCTEELTRDINQAVAVTRGCNVPARL